MNILANQTVYTKLPRLILVGQESHEKFGISILLTSSKNQIYEFRIPNIFSCLNENLTTFLYTLSLTEATRKQSVYISRML